MLDLKKYRFTLVLTDGNVVSFDTYCSTESERTIEKRVEHIKHDIFQFNDYREFEPNRFCADMKSDNFEASLEMYCTTRREFIARCNLINFCIESISYEEIEDDEE